ncbi:MAG: hypothetical protein AAF446_05800 [Pseudomonadota bacterium]
MTSNNDFDLQDRIVRQLEMEQNALSPAITLRLDRTRRQAQTDSATTQRTLNPWPWLATAGSVSLALLLIIELSQPSVVPPPDSLDLDLLTLSEFDLLDQDPEFMLWLAEQEEDLLNEAPSLTTGESS